MLEALCCLTTAGNRPGQSVIPYMNHTLHDTDMKTVCILSPTFSGSTWAPKAFPHIAANSDPAAFDCTPVSSKQGSAAACFVLTAACTATLGRCSCTLPVDDLCCGWRHEGIAVAKDSCITRCLLCCCGLAYLCCCCCQASPADPRILKQTLLVNCSSW